MTDKIIIQSPHNCFRESQYVWRYLIEDVLGWNMDIASTEGDYHILQAGNKKLHFRNTFFTTDDLGSLLTKDNIPKTLNREKIIISGRAYNISSVYGLPIIHKRQDNLFCDFDIVASTFFMLSRWEERHILRDEHDRPKASDSLLGKSELLLVPIVNEYIDILEALVFESGWRQERKKNIFQICPTHDIDHLYLSNATLDLVRKIAFSTVKEPSLKDIMYKAASLGGKDLYDRYDDLMDEADKIDVKAVFYFLMSDDTQYDYKKLPKTKEYKSVIEKILSRGHEVGIHPSYATTNLNKEIILLKESGAIHVVKTRQHYLRYSETLLDLWEEIGIKQDSTLGYADALGFRCGICYDFPMYHLKQRRVSTVWQRPLLIMDVTLRRMDGTIADKENSILEIATEVKKHNGNFTFLWHNSSFDINGWYKYESLYKTCYAA